MKLTLTILTFCILTFFAINVHAEIYAHDTVRIENATQTVTFLAYYNLLDTSPGGIGQNKAVPIGLYTEIEALPYNISTYYPQYSNALVDWCNYTIKKYNNQWDGEGHIINTTTTIVNSYYSATGNGSTNYTEWNLFDQDEISATVTCHYTNADTLFLDSMLFGRTTTFYPAMACRSCEGYSFEELAHENDNLNAAIENEVAIYGYIQKAMKVLYQFWLIFKWVTQIALIFIAISLLIQAGKYVYLKIVEMEKKT